MTARPAHGVGRRHATAALASLPLAVAAAPAAMRALAQAEDVPLLDVQALSLTLWQKLGVEETKAYCNWTATEQDNTHFNPPGAIAVARLVAAELLHRGVLAARDVRRLDAPMPDSWITWPEGP